MGDESSNVGVAGYPLEGGRVVMPEPAVKARLAEAGIAVPAPTGERLVLKAFGPGIVHKSDVGAVRLGLTAEEVDGAEVEMAAVLATHGLTADGFLVEAMAPAGIEVLVGVVRTPFGLAVTAVGAVGEFGPLLAISLFLSGRTPLAAALVLIAFAVIAAAAVWFAARGGHERFHALARATLHTSGQFAIRFVVLVVAGLVGLSLALGLDMLLGAFAAFVEQRMRLIELAEFAGNAAGQNFFRALVELSGLFVSVHRKNLYSSDV